MVLAKSSTPHKTSHSTIFLCWLLLSFIALLALHAGNLSRWVLGAGAIAALWRIQCSRGQWPEPANILKYALLLLMVAGLFISYRTAFALEPMVELLVASYVLKFMEMKHNRDTYVVLLLGHFIAALQALMSQSMATAVAILGCQLLLFAALFSFHQYGANSRTGISTRSGSQSSVFFPLKRGGIMLLQAIPIMLILFVAMPRIGSLWSVPMAEKSGKTGMSDSMSPGDFSELTRSPDIAFRAVFNNGIPPQNALYWRGLVFTEFDGRRWFRSSRWLDRSNNLLRRFGEPAKNWDVIFERNGEPVSYQLIMEPTYKDWLFALPTPMPQQVGMGLTPNSRLIADKPINHKRQFAVKSWLDYRLEPNGLVPERHMAFLSLPADSNPRAMKLAQRWRQQYPDKRQLLQQALDVFNREFTYTLKPPALGQHSIDEFLFDTKRGFCEHFSGSFVFLMRAAGIPARVVTGYQGGERHQAGYVIVRQYDAHAWAEVWLPGEGWVRVDPTAAVAPDRVESDMQTLFGDNQQFLAQSPTALVKYRHIPLLNSIRLGLEKLDYQWARWVLDYTKLQDTLLQKKLGLDSIWKLAIVLFSAAALVLVVLCLVIFIPLYGRGRDKSTALFLSFCKRCEKLGVPRRTGEGAKDFSARLGRLRPELALATEQVYALYEQIEYGQPLNTTQKNILLKKLKRAVQQFSKQSKNS